MLGTNYYDQYHQQEDERVKWLTHYSSNHHILLVGDGDFSFSLCLARSFGSAFNIVATSLDSNDEVIKKYKHAKSNLIELHKLRACILHGVDATRMKFHHHLMSRRFDRIIFNFPHAGFQGREENIRVIRMHRDLIRGFFSNAKSLLRTDGEIHVSHKTTAPFSEWNLEGLALSNSLVLIERAKFKKEDYPTYDQKRGDGRRCDKPFPLGESSTFKFRLSPNLYKFSQTAHSIHTSSGHSFDMGRSTMNRISTPDHSACAQRGHHRGTHPELDHVGSALGRSLSQRLQFLPGPERGSLCRTYSREGFELNRRTFYGGDYRFDFDAVPVAMMSMESRLSYDIGRTNASRLVRRYGTQYEPFSDEVNLRITRIMP